MRTLGPWQLQFSFLVSSGFGLRVTLATKDELGSVPSSSVWKMLPCAGTFSSQIVIHSEATIFFVGRYFFFLLLIRPDFLMIWKKIFRFSFHLDSADASNWHILLCYYSLLWASLFGKQLGFGLNLSEEPGLPGKGISLWLSVVAQHCR